MTGTLERDRSSGHVPIRCRLRPLRVTLTESQAVNRGLNVFVWVWNQSEGSVCVFTLEPWKVKVQQAHRRSERESKRSLEEKLSCCLPTDRRQADRQSVQQGGGDGQGHAGCVEIL